MTVVFFLAAAYLVGAIPAGYLLVRVAEKRDIRAFGSRNTGATNVLRMKGWRYAVPVLLFDAAKGLAPALLGKALFHDVRVAAAGAFLAVLGHCFPVYIGLRGGKGVATTLGAFAGLALAPGLVSVGVALAAIAVVRMVSVGSLAGVAAFPAAALAFGAPAAVVLFGVGVLAVVGLRHRENIGRILSGTERKLGSKA